MPSRVGPLLVLALALGFSTAFFFVPYRYFPHRRVPAGAALAGALLAAVLWEAAKQLFRWYILSFGVYDQIYGPLGVLVALACSPTTRASSSSWARSSPRPSVRVRRG